MTAWPHAERFEPLSPEALDRWARFVPPERIFFPTHVGLVVEELRRGYARMRLPDRDEVRQAAGVVHGGALATLMDTVSVPALANWYETQPDLLTVSFNINFLGAVDREDAIGEAWVEQAGRSIAFVRAEVHAHSGGLAATASLVFKVRERSGTG